MTFESGRKREGIVVGMGSHNTTHIVHRTQSYCLLVVVAICAFHSLFFPTFNTLISYHQIILLTKYLFFLCFHIYASIRWCKCLSFPTSLLKILSISNSVLAALLRWERKSIARDKLLEGGKLKVREISKLKNEVGRINTLKIEKYITWGGKR